MVTIYILLMAFIFSQCMIETMFTDKDIKMSSLITCSDSEELNNEQDEIVDMVAMVYSDCC